MDSIDMAYYLFILSKNFFTRVIAGQSVYCIPPWSLAVQCVEHIRTCQAKSPMTTKVVIVFLDWPQFNAATVGLRLLRKVPTNFSDDTCALLIVVAPTGKFQRYRKIYQILDENFPLLSLSL